MAISMGGRGSIAHPKLCRLGLFPGTGYLLGVFNRKVQHGDGEANVRFSSATWAEENIVPWGKRKGLPTEDLGLTTDGSDPECATGTSE